MISGLHASFLNFLRNKAAASKKVAFFGAVMIGLVVLPAHHAAFAQEAADNNMTPMPAEEQLVEPDAAAAARKKQQREAARAKRAQMQQQQPPAADTDAKPLAELEQELPEDAGRYYDAKTLVPDPELGVAVGPRKVDPKFEPGQKYIIVETNKGAGSSEAMLVSANRAMKLGRYASAMEMFEHLHKKNRRDPRILMGLAISQQKSGFTESAIQTYEELLKIDSDNTDALVNMLGLVRMQYPSVALVKLKELRDKDPRDGGVAAQIGLTSAELGNHEEALRYLGIAASLEPSNASHVYNMAVITDQMGNRSGAMELYEKALELDAAYGHSRSISRETVYDRLAVLRRR